LKAAWFQPLKTSQVKTRFPKFAASENPVSQSLLFQILQLVPLRLGTAAASTATFEKEADEKGRDGLLNKPVTQTLKVGGCTSSRIQSSLPIA
jgi:hypothetical protein